MNTKTIIHLLSGGIDSTVMLYDLIGQGHRVHALLVNYGQTHIKELEFAILHCRRMGVFRTELNIGPLPGSTLTDGSGSVVVPGRNIIFLAHALNVAMKAKADTITIGCNKDDEAVFPDCRQAFLQMFNTMATTADIPVEICAPYLDKSKAWIMALGQELGVPLDDTWSCYAGGATPCGVCLACQKRNGK